MTNRILDDYMDELKLRLRRLRLSEQREVLAEVRSHLEEDIRQRRKADKKLSADEATLQATHAFGDPKDIGVSYGADGGVIRKSTGEVLVHAAVLTGRGIATTVRGTFKWTGIVVASIVGVLLLVAGTLLFTFKDEIREVVADAADTHVVYSYQESWAPTSPQNGPRTDTFQVADGYRVEIRLQTMITAGCAAIQVTGPDGAVMYTNGEGCQDVSKTLSYNQPGTWTIRYTFVAFVGMVDNSAVETPQD